MNQVYTKKVSTLTEKIMGQSLFREGNLTVGTVRPNLIVRCVHDLRNNQRFQTFWTNIMKMQAFIYLPEPMNLYVIRAYVTGLPGVAEWFSRGVVLSQMDGKHMENPGINLNGGLHVEPYFPLNCFDVSQSRP